MRTPKTNPLIAALAKILAFLTSYPPRKAPAEKIAPCQCRRCGRPLTSEASRAAGIGPVCAKLEKLESVHVPREEVSRGKATAGPNQLAFDFNGAGVPPKAKVTGKELRELLGMKE